MPSSVYRIKEKNTGFFVGFHDNEARYTFDLYGEICEQWNGLYKTKSKKDAEIICMILNKLPVHNGDGLAKWSNWEFVVEKNNR